MSMTTYKVNDYDFSEKTSEDKKVLVTNGLGRDIGFAELVYLDGYFGEVLETGGIADGETGYININHERIIRTAQIETTDTFTRGNNMWFVSGGSSAAGKLVDADPGSGTRLKVGIIEGEGGSGGAQTYVEFRPFVQRTDSADVEAQVETNTSAIGTLSSLTTTEQGSLVGAINEVDANADSNATDIATNAADIATLQSEMLVEQAEPKILKFALTVDGSSGVAITGLGAGDEIIDAKVICTVAETNGTLKITDGTNDITDAIACAVDKTVTQVGTIDDAHNVIGGGDTATVVAAGDTAANTRGILVITYIPA